MKPITLKLITDFLKDFTKENKMLNTFIFGKELEKKDEILFPCLQVYPTNAAMTMDAGNGSYYKEHEITFVFKVLDKKTEYLNDEVEQEVGESSNIIDTESDTLLICQDLINFFNSYPKFNNDNFLKITNNVSFSLIENFGSEDLTGWEFELFFKVVNKAGYWGLPQNNLTYESVYESCGDNNSGTSGGGNNNGGNNNGGGDNTPSYLKVFGHYNFR